MLIKHEIIGSVDVFLEMRFCTCFYTQIPLFKTGDIRGTSIDVAAEVKCLQMLIGMNCSEVYEVSPQTYVFEMENVSGVSSFLLMESGARLHTIQDVRDSVNTPSAFTLKVRESTRTRRLEAIRQIGYDRRVFLQFGPDYMVLTCLERFFNALYIILELFSRGNIILTGPDYMVLTCLERNEDEDAIVAPYRYPVSIRSVFEPVDGAKLQAILASFNNTEAGNEAPAAPQSKNGKGKGVKPNHTSQKKDNAPAKQASLKVFLGDVLGYGPLYCEHIILDAGLNPDMKLSKDLKLEENGIQALSTAVQRFEAWLEDVISGAKVPEGYILVPAESSSSIQGFVSL